MRSAIAVAVLSLGVMPLQQPARVASQLSKGMALVYVSDGRSQPPWLVDSLGAGDPLRPGTDCASVSLRRGATDRRPEHSRLCLSSDTLYRWESARKSWSMFRPVGPDMSFTIVKANGDSVHYATGALGEDMISGTAIQVVNTTMTTVDALGRPRLRVRERYAVSLATATSGTFEAPDPAGGGRWVPKHTFELKELRPASP
ncbi:MAG: hypothetical protein ACREL3_02155 [Gemmatimonadales bacterium]